MKKLMFSVAILFFVAPAYAQQATPIEYNLKLTAQEVDILGKAIGKLPYEEVAILVQKIRQQIVEQQQVKEPEKK